MIASILLGVLHVIDAVQKWLNERKIVIWVFIVCDYLYMTLRSDVINSFDLSAIDTVDATFHGTSCIAYFVCICL